MYNGIGVFQLKKMLIQLTCLLHSQNALRNKEMEMRLKQQSSKIATLKRKVCQLETTVGKNNLSVEHKMLRSIFSTELFLNGFAIVIQTLDRWDFECFVCIFLCMYEWKRESVKFWTIIEWFYHEQEVQKTIPNFLNCFIDRFYPKIEQICLKPMAFLL